MKLYNSILSEIEESIGAMEASIDPFNILDIILITPDDNFLNIVRYIDSDKLERYTKDMNVIKAESLFNSSIKYTLWDYDLRIKCLRFIWFLCNKIIPRLYNYWETATGGINITFDELINDSDNTINIINVHPYRLDGSEPRGKYALRLIGLGDANALLFYTNNLRKND